MSGSPKRKRPSAEVEHESFLQLQRERHERRSRELRKLASQAEADERTRSEAEQLAIHQQQQADNARAAAEKQAHEESIRIRLAPVYAASREMRQIAGEMRLATSSAAIVRRLNAAALVLKQNFSIEVQRSLPFPEEEPLVLDAQRQLQADTSDMLDVLNHSDGYIVDVTSPDMPAVKALVKTIGDAAGVEVEVGQTRMHTAGDADMARTLHMAEKHIFNQAAAAASSRFPVAIEPPPPPKLDIIEAKSLLMRLIELHDRLIGIDSWTPRALDLSLQRFRVWQSDALRVWVVGVIFPEAGTRQHARALRLQQSTSDTLAAICTEAYEQISGTDERVSAEYITRNCLDLVDTIQLRLQQ